MQYARLVLTEIPNKIKEASMASRRFCVPDSSSNRDHPESTCSGLTQGFWFSPARA